MSRVHCDSVACSRKVVGKVHCRSKIRFLSFFGKQEIRPGERSLILHVLTILDNLPVTRDNFPATCDL